MKLILINLIKAGEESKVLFAGGGEGGGEGGEGALN